MEYIDGETVMFRELQERLDEDHRALLVGYKRNGKYDLNPTEPVELRSSDDLVYLADEPLDNSIRS